MEKLRIGVGGSAANPPHLGHRVLVETLLNCGRLDHVYWSPSGVRPDKEGFVSPDHRVAMTVLTFPTEWLWAGKAKFSIKFDDVYDDFSPAIEVLERFNVEFPGAEVMWFTGVDSVVPQERFGGKCEIQAVWVRGEELYKNHKFLILPRPGFVDPKTLGLPANFEILDMPQLDISSSDIRARVGKGEPIVGLVTKEVEEYIRINNLYKSS